MTFHRRPELWGLAAGLALGFSDFYSLLFFGADLSTDRGFDLSWPLGAAIVSSFGALGWMTGRVVRDRTRAQEDAATIQRQLQALELSHRKLLQQEKLAAIGRPY